MWIIEILAIIFTLGIFFTFLAIIGALQIIQTLFGIIIFILVLPFAILTALVRNMTTQRRYKNRFG